MKDRWNRVDISDLVKMFRVGGRSVNKVAGWNRCRKRCLVSGWTYTWMSDSLQLESRSLTLNFTLLLLTGLLASILPPLSKKFSTALFLSETQLWPGQSPAYISSMALLWLSESWTSNMAYKYPSWSGLSFLIGPPYVYPLLQPLTSTCSSVIGRYHFSLLWYVLST